MSGDRFEGMDTADLVDLVVDQLNDADHPPESDECPFCDAISAVNELHRRAAAVPSREEEK